MDHVLKRAAFALASIAAASACAAQHGTLPMDNATRARIAAAAATSGHWQAADVKVKPNDELDRAGCRFLLAYNAKAMDAFPLNYALLPDGRIAGVDLTGNAAVTTLLRACGKEADANWWAAVTTRFSGQIGGIPLTADSFASQIQKVRDAGAEFKPPTLTRGNDAVTLEFFSLGEVMPVGEFIPYHVTAVLPKDGELTVQVQRLSRNAAHPR